MAEDHCIKIGPCVIRDVAEEIYRFLLGDSEISEPEKSRNKWRHESEISQEEYRRIHADLHGIDWSWTTPRLVRSKTDASVILETTGRHVQDMFEGIENAVGRRYGWFQKSEYRYHGEIPQEPKTEGLNFLEAIHAAKCGSNIRRAEWVDEFYWYHSNDAMYDSDTDRIDIITPSNVLATDWEIVK